MNIKEAKEQIENAMRAYFSKNQFGRYVIPLERQRPIFLMGPPGIGKTAIMEQIARDLNVSLVSYSMTHHTRQSALGLPYIIKKRYGDEEYEITEYTMSEIIASVYNMIEETGNPEGILFLDEINCVSETLAPAMLQFLQYKVFGRHKVPSGWIVVTAGNPQEYNHSVHDFDIVTWDRLKRIDVEPDYETWKEFAYKIGTHPSITTYLDIKKADFYTIESTVDGKQFVTARGWSDLSEMIRLYEKNNLKVDENLIAQYLQHPKIAKDFAIYYDLFNKYRSDYQVDQILDGFSSDTIKERARNAKFDERLSLLGLLLDRITDHLKAVCTEENSLAELYEELKFFRIRTTKEGASPIQSLEKQIQVREQALLVRQKSGNLSSDDEFTISNIIHILEWQNELLQRNGLEDPAQAFKALKEDYDRRREALKFRANEANEKLSNLFLFCEEVFDEGQEMLILITELTVSYYGAKFIGKYNNKEYFKHNKELLFYERQKEILSEL